MSTTAQAASASTMFSFSPLVVSSDSEAVRTEVLNRIKTLVDDYVHRLVMSQATGGLDRPRLPVSSMSFAEAAEDEDVEDSGNGNGDDVPVRVIAWQMLSRRSRASHHEVMRLLAFIVKELVVPRRTMTLRDVFYSFKGVDACPFTSYQQLVCRLSDICNMLVVPRRSLGLVATPRGWIFGMLTIERSAHAYTVSGNANPTVDCASSIQSISEGLVASGCRYTSHAKQIIVLEKEGIFKRLVESRWCSHMPSILITGQGFPSLAVRALVKTLHQRLNIPVYGLFDFNPYGVLIYSTYRFGSRMLESQLYTVPAMRYLGLAYRDAVEINRNWQPFTQRDSQILSGLRANTQLRGLAEELAHMERDGRKMELQTLYTLGWTHTRDWLVRKILKKDWLE